MGYIFLGCITLICLILFYRQIATVVFMFIVVGALWLLGCVMASVWRLIFA